MKSPSWTSISTRSTTSTRPSRGGKYSATADQDTLRRAGAERADAFVAATRGDNRNALAAQIALHVFQIQRVSSVIFDPMREEVYRGLGLRTINPTKLEAKLLRELIQQEDE
jgi:trk system potassium uptake protein TrkA